MDLEEKPEQTPIGRPVGVEDDLDRLSVGFTIAICRIRRVATGIADSGRHEGALRTEVVSRTAAARTQ
jgi:hypothetical protein